MTIERIVLDSVKNIKNELVSDVAPKTPVNPPSTQITTEHKSQENNNQIGIINAYNKNKRLNIMVIGAAIGLIFCLLILTSYKGDLPEEVVGIISTVAGIFGACLKDAYSFEFGSSRGSKDKDERISSTILEKIKY